METQNNNGRPELGDLVKCKVTGYTGVLVAVTRWMTGCDRCLIQSQELKDGKPIEGHNVDITLLEIKKRNVITPENRTFPVEALASVKGGPRPAPNIKPAPTR